MHDIPLPTPQRPEILAPAGDTPSFLAGLAAGADAIYLGLKHFSARMQAENFSLTELSRLTDLAHSEQARVYVAMNTLVKPGEPAAAYRLIHRLARQVKPDGLIVQDLAFVDIARQAGFEGGLFLSTLANLTSPQSLLTAKALGASRVILPRELSIDEIRLMGEACPDGLDLECFIHGALCYCVSGRCYWSSYMGGKSGLRGRCVQPCRRVYRQKGREGRFFSCRDLSLDVLVKTLLDIPKLRCLKIEGRKKGPHYVYHAVAAYRLLLDSMRDGGSDPRARKDAEALLEMALGRPRTHALFLPQREQPVSTPDDPTSSGLLIGKIQFSQAERGQGQPFVKPRLELLPQDLLRIGYEDEPWHDTVPVTRRAPKAGTLPLRLARHKTPKAGTPVFLIDRREPGLTALLREWDGRLARRRVTETKEVEFAPRLPAPIRARRQPDILVRSSLPQGRETRGGRMTMTGLWMSPNTVRAVSRTVVPRVSWWLPPVIWPDEEAVWLRLVGEALRNGARHFVCNAPWQIALFPAQGRPRPETRGPERKPARESAGLRLSAGPFCNVSNAAAVAVLAGMGFADAFVSPELTVEDMLALPRQSCLPLGAVTEGWWPVGISRHKLEQIKANEPFISPKGESFWARTYGRNLWIYPGWPLDITAHRPELENAGYAFFARLDETPPPSLPTARRTSEFNWQGALL